jgi:hypothetical protein
LPDDLVGWTIQNVSKINLCPTKTIIDIVSLLEHLQDTGKSSDAKINSKATAKRGGYKNLLIARTLTSCSVIILIAFNGSATDDVFGKIKTYKAWSDSRTGFVKTMSDQFTLWHTGFTGDLSLNYPVSRHPVLNTLLASLAASAIQFFHGVAYVCPTGFYDKLTRDVWLRPLPNSKSEQTEYKATLLDTGTEAWNLLMAFLMDVFQELSMRRATGMAAEDMEDGSAEQFATAVYASMRAHKYCAELIAKKFQKHPMMAPAFNAFLFSKRAQK